VDGLEVSIEKGASELSIVIGSGVAIDGEGNEIHLCAPVKVSLPEASGALRVGIRFAERFTGSIPVPGKANEPNIMPGRVEEGCEVILEPLGVATASRAASDSKAMAVSACCLDRRLATGSQGQSSAYPLTCHATREHCRTVSAACAV
jgi:hypothetical protein